MADLLVTFRTDVPESQRQEILAEVKRWSAVSAAAPLKQDAKSPALRRFSYVRVDDAEIDRVADILRAKPEIEAAEVAPRRGLATN